MMVTDVMLRRQIGFELLSVFKGASTESIDDAVEHMLCLLTRPTADLGEDHWPADALFERGALVKKKGRASWRGRVVGWYRTELTPLGFAVESAFEPGSVQIYPQTGLEAWDGRSGG